MFVMESVGQNIFLLIQLLEVEVELVELLAPLEEQVQQELLAQLVLLEQELQELQVLQEQLAQLVLLEQELQDLLALLAQQERLERLE
jgi:hypothetical protein